MGIGAAVAIGIDVAVKVGVSVEVGVAVGEGVVVALPAGGAAWGIIGAQLLITARGCVSLKVYKVQFKETLNAKPGERAVDVLCLMETDGCSYMLNFFIL